MRNESRINALNRQRSGWTLISGLTDKRRRKTNASNRLKRLDAALRKIKVELTRQTTKVAVGR